MRVLEAPVVGELPERQCVVGVDRASGRKLAGRWRRSVPRQIPDKQRGVGARRRGEAASPRLVAPLARARGVLAQEGSRISSTGHLH